MNRKQSLAPLLAALVLGALPVRAQSLPEAVEAIERSRVTTRILYVTAHPDDESSSVLTYLARGLGADVALLSITRGEGGQNALGPEQGSQLGILRTAELEAATRAYGVRLYFTRAPDFGYSKTPEETLRVWGDTALEDMVRVIRTFRPHIIINHWGGVRTGHGHHQASGILTPQAFQAAGDPKTIPHEALKPWRAMLLLELLRGEAKNGYRVPSEKISPLWGKSYNEIGLEGFKNHRTQGIAAFLGSPFLRRPIFLTKPDGTPVNPAQLAEPLASLAAGFPSLRSILEPGLVRADQSLAQARQAALALDWRRAAADLARAGRQLQELGDLVLHRDAELGKDPAASEVAVELSLVRQRIDAAMGLVLALRIEVQADRSDLVAGEGFTVNTSWSYRSEVPVRFGGVSVSVPTGWQQAQLQAGSTSPQLRAYSIPPDSKPPDTRDSWMFPWPPPLVSAAVEGEVEDYRFSVREAAMAAHATSTRVDTVPLELVPALTLTLEPGQVILVEKRPAKPLELFARVHYYGSTTAKVTLGVDAPAGWQIIAPEPLEFDGAGDQLVRFVVAPPARVAAGNYVLRAYAKRGEEIFRTSVEPLPSLPTRLWSEPAVAAVHAFDMTLPEGLRVGYVAAENDPIPDALRRLGLEVELLDPVALAFSDLRRFDAIAVGIRAYELRDDLARANKRLLEYARAGGTLVVQYQRENVWSKLKPAPFPAAIGNPTVRITDENSPVRFLLPDHPVLNFPNKISEKDFLGWFQERGLYLWSQWDQHYQPVLAMRDPGEQEVTGGLLYARYGKGVYIYTGLAFFRQLPEGVPGAYRLFVNLLSQSKAR
ncbi:MAG TPA: PIG-L family deacetylase [Candidatus Acidoferrales bacterium]|nr:PIG-L family deacetylase [Candidatus Acidoferrales bacterium]